MISELHVPPSLCICLEPEFYRLYGHFTTHYNSDAPYGCEGLWEYFKMFRFTLETYCGNMVVRVPMVSTIAGASISVLVSSNHKNTRKSRWLDLPPVTNALRKNADRRKGGFFIPKFRGKENTMNDKNAVKMEKSELMKLVDITPYANNPRKNDRAIEPVMNSIREFGFNQPIVVDKDHVIIVGHTRYLAALELGLEEVPVYVAAHLSEEQARAYRLADNKTNELSEWDAGLLELELDAVEDLDMSDYGFEDDDVELDIPKDSKDDSESLETQEYMKFAGHNVPMSDYEVELLEKKLNEYTDEAGTAYGFVRHILEE